MNELIKIEIVTPLELLKSKETKMSVLPGSEGELGIMSRHTPLMTLLNRGIIKLFDENNSVTDQIAVDGGVADVSEEGIKEFLNESIAGYKVPEVFHISKDPLPRIATEKIDRVGIKKILSSQ